MSVSENIEFALKTAGEKKADIELKVKVSDFVGD